MTKISFALAGLCSTAMFIQAADYSLHTFKKIQLTDKFWSEGAAFGDFNHDGKMDVVSGPYWWEGPDFKVQHEYYPAKTTFKLKKADGTETAVPGFEGALGKNNTYSDNFFAFTHDFNKDGWTDILIYGFPGKDASWYENPKGKKAAGNAEAWTRHQVFDVVDNESPAWLDLTGDGKPEIICNSGGYFGYVTPDWNDTTKPWTFHKISPKGGWQRFTHGLGLGDINGDGKPDLLEMNGWWEQPASLEGDPEWKQHKVAFAPGSGSAQMFADDVNGDGRNDVISCLAAHGYGLAWYEQLAEKEADGGPKFTQHVIMNKEPKENKYGVKFAQLHALDLVDMDGDGLKDIVTGKRFWAHGATGDAEPNAPAVVYWFKLVRDEERIMRFVTNEEIKRNDIKGAELLRLFHQSIRRVKGVDFVPYQIDDDSGVGTQVMAGDLNGDKLPDIVVGNKKGTFVHLHEVKKVSRDEWVKAQPKPYMAPAASTSAR